MTLYVVRFDTHSRELETAGPFTTMKRARDFVSADISAGTRPPHVRVGIFVGDDAGEAVRAAAGAGMFTTLPALVADPLN